MNALELERRKLDDEKARLDAARKAFEEQAAAFEIQRRQQEHTAMQDLQRKAEEHALQLVRQRRELAGKEKPTLPEPITPVTAPDPVHDADLAERKKKRKKSVPQPAVSVTDTSSPGPVALTTEPVDSQIAPKEAHVEIQTKEQTIISEQPVRQAEPIAAPSKDDVKTLEMGSKPSIAPHPPSSPPRRPRTQESRDHIRPPTATIPPIPIIIETPSSTESSQVANAPHVSEEAVPTKRLSELNPPQSFQPSSPKHDEVQAISRDIEPRLFEPRPPSSSAPQVPGSANNAGVMTRMARKYSRPSLSEQSATPRGSMDSSPSMPRDSLPPKQPSIGMNMRLIANYAIFNSLYLQWKKTKWMAQTLIRH